MELLSIVGLGLVVAAISLVLRQHKPEFAVLVSLAGGIVILYQVFVQLVPVVDEIQLMMDSAAMPDQYVGILMRCLGICFLTQMACDTCKDAGEQAVSTKVELAGKVAVLVISLPLFRQVLDIVGTLL